MERIFYTPHVNMASCRGCGRVFWLNPEHAVYEHADKGCPTCEAAKRRGLTP